MPEPEPEFLGVTELNLADPDAWADTAVAESCRRILDDLDRSSESISGWSSYLADEDD